ncbi:MAG: gliding motility-associated C-terminal domain-containing protein [Bacteroidia bacterium]|nr:gliding motility-associated C-terminal domain-containing protein [Bacteroidia bacterium]MBP7260238.1 gliding motility-associated C-terminal domain-containing protein [Bacteroidia bacterium]MBP9180522.1 gliding motility-associated C-terminal domain-containing protein [Bacteroidia bacterium]MBP9724484.1 gliding motility-associated C-terminal domain-containing protein [Bacteroidia bacterium]
MKTIVTIVLLLVFGAPTHAQYNNVWCFGRQSGLDFSSSPPQKFTSAIYPNLTDVPGESVTVCDSTGNLLFYACPNKVYNSQHQLILNGDSLTTSGLINGSRHMCAVGPIGNLYYVFTTPLSYFIVNPFYNNNQGYVTKKQIVFDRDSKKLNITAIRNIDKPNSFWIVADSKDTLLIYKLDASGLSRHNTYFHRVLSEPGYEAGLLRASHDGKLIISCSGHDTSKYDTRFYNFDNTTGQITGEQGIKLATSLYIDSTKGYRRGPTGVAFSPNDSIIYFNGFVLGPSPFKIIQLNRYNPAQQYYFYTSSNQGDIELAPDGKIYSTNYYSTTTPGYLAVINKPDVLGLGCQYITNGLLVGNMKNVIGLPSGYDEYRRLTFYYYNDCSGAIKLQNVSDTSFFKTFSWYWGDGDSLVNQPFSAIVSHTYSQSGKYLVKLRASTQYGYTIWFTDTINFVKPPVADFAFKTDTGCQWVQFKFTNLSHADSMAVQGMKWLWHFGDGQTDTAENAAHAYKKSGNFSVKLVADNGFCSDSISKTNSVYILPAPKPGFSATPLYGCAPLNVQVTDTVGFGVSKKEYFFEDSLTWSSQLLPQFARTFVKPGSWKIIQKLTGVTGCITTDSATVTIREGFSHLSKSDISLASYQDDSSILVQWNKILGAKQYELWHSLYNSSYALLHNTIDSFFIHQPSQNSTLYEHYYKVLPVDSCDNKGEAGNYAKPIVLEGKSIENKEAILKYTPYETWSKGIREYRLEVVEDDNSAQTISTKLNAEPITDTSFWEETRNYKCYRIVAISEGDSLIKSTSNKVCLYYVPKLYIPNAFSPNGDNINDTYKISSIGVTQFEFSIFNIWGERVFHTNDKNFEWDGKNVPTGVYAYVVSANNTLNKRLNSMGTISLVK